VTYEEKYSHLPSRKRIREIWNSTPKMTKRGPDKVALCCSHMLWYSRGLCTKCYGRLYSMRPGQDRKKQRGMRMRKYGITPEDYQAMLDSQGGKCAICKIRDANRIDHCHKTGKTRQLLCNQCNTAIGMFKEDVNILLTAIDYIRKHCGKTPFYV
jgi:hypothetical protein